MQICPKSPQFTVSYKNVLTLRDHHLIIWYEWKNILNEILITDFQPDCIWLAWFCGFLIAGKPVDCCFPFYTSLFSNKENQLNSDSKKIELEFQ